ncbi:hypothetical protein B5C34_02065 [Pacificimonas flava]|uniref:PEP-CTERM protein-sorting domain-containing protein n=2 Tax=Pacificimonas TaxID=1960290 RepID=A0A219B3F9_9SPHN|nr:MULTISPECIES: hypothetical protein [Pacificimonas]MBZ6377996.1 hypothetical protein [Pacificimonas aurantium]OWV32358.1 hypothetical protein B5C34_02065 [Pacificimonas flava]
MKSGKFLTVALLLPLPAGAVQIVPDYYDTPNGDAGTYTYFDDSYDGLGDKTNRYGYLSGGSGDLTDGVIATQPWPVEEGPGGGKAYVGWIDADPVPVFHFADPAVIDSIVIHQDDADGVGGVDHIPRVGMSAWRDGTVVFDQEYFFSDPAGTGPTAITLDTSAMPDVDRIALRMNRLRDGRDHWVFVSEIQFFQADAIPSPASFGLLGLGALTAAGLRRRGPRSRSRPRSRV